MLCVLAVILACKWPNAYTLTLAIVTGFYVAGEALNILYQAYALDSSHPNL